MLWVYILGWAVGAWLVIAGVALAMGVRGVWGRASAALMVIGAVLLVVCVVAGTRELDRQHGVRPDVAQWSTWR